MPKSAILFHFLLKQKITAPMFFHVKSSFLQERCKKIQAFTSCFQIWNILKNLKVIRKKRFFQILWIFSKIFQINFHQVYILILDIFSENFRFIMLKLLVPEGKVWKFYSHKKFHKIFIFEDNQNLFAGECFLHLDL